ncbi:MAG: hypothetical protein K0S35_2365 [Geminicoccaceae bacterium]|nr:hypothetical protein [Geminicoccaceae bacterium]
METDHVAVEADLQVIGRQQGGAIRLAEAGRGTDLEDQVAQAAAVQVEDRRAEALSPGARRGVESADLTEITGHLVVGREVGAPERPAAVGDPGPDLEVEVLEREAVPAPMVRRAAEVAQAGIVGLVGRTDRLAPIELLHVGSEIEAAGFDEADIDVGAAGEGRGQGNPGSTAADDAQIAVQKVIRRQCPAINQHARVRPLQRHGMAAWAFAALTDESGRRSTVPPRGANIS